MFKVSIRNLLANKIRLLLTIAAVTVGVSFVSGTFVLSDTMGKAFDELYAGLTSGTDVVVRAKTPYELDVTTGAQPRPMDESIVAAFYYGGKNEGFGTFVKVPPAPPGEPAFGPAYRDDPRNGKPLQSCRLPRARPRQQDLRQPRFKSSGTAMCARR